MKSNSIEYARRRLFNSICMHVMPEVENLKMIYDNSGESHAIAIEKALNRLKLAIAEKNNPVPGGHGFLNYMLGTEGDNSVISGYEIDVMSLSTIDELLDATIATYELKSQDQTRKIFHRNGSLREALNNNSLFKKTSILTTVEMALSSLNNLRTVDLIDYFSMPTISCRKTNATKLCQLAQYGSANLSKIQRELDFSHAEVTQLVSWAVVGKFPTYLGVYNALSIAIYYDHLDLVKYFVEQKHANLNIKCGRNHDFTVSDCAKREPFGLKSNRNMIDYLERVYKPQDTINVRSKPNMFKIKALENASSVVIGKVNELR